VTRNPNIKSISDFTEKDKIAVPTIKVSMQSTILGIAAGNIYGESGRTHFDPFTVAMSHPDATVALLSGRSEVNSHFSAPPYQYQAMKGAGVREILNSTDVMGGPATITVLFGMTRFRDANPKTMAAINAALNEAMDFIAKDKRAAADVYLKISREKMTVDDLATMIAQPGFNYTTTPNGIMKYAEQMNKTGVIKAKPATWKDPFFPEAHGLAGT
jgi:NitT/TauT family transport system substrate-binding protein